MKTVLKIFPWFCLVFFAIEIVAVMWPKADVGTHTREFGRLPVLSNGRIQPFDSVGRNSLLQIRSTGDLPLEQVPSWQFWRHGKKLRSTEWLLEVMFKSELADTRPAFLIHHPDLISELKLGERGIERSGLRYYTFNELEPVLGEIQRQARKAGELEDAQRTSYQKQVLKLANAVNLYRRLKNSIQPEAAHNFSELIADYQANLATGVAAIKAQNAGAAPDQKDEAALRKFAAAAQQFDMVANFAVPFSIPPAEPTPHHDGWVNPGTSLLGMLSGAELNPAVEFYARMATAYAHDNAAEFNSAVAGYKNWLEPKYPKEVAKGRSEFYFNQIKAFLHATIIYIAAFVLAGGALLTFGSWPTLSESLRRAAFYLIGLAFVLHTFALIYRMVLEARPPVTNLYSSAIFIGWGTCVLGWILERIYRVGIGAAVAGLSGFVTLLIAHNLGLGGDTMEMMRAVLDTNFWLATHVVVVTLGYSATFMAGTLALAYVFLGVFTPLLGHRLGASAGSSMTNVASDSNIGRALTAMVYAIVCFATLFSFTGTVLGGIWADQSWGRFWGWDPKENGALLIVIWNAIILHARWGGLVKERGLMNLAIFGNVITAWSWFGVNMLGIGLHSYGFMDSAFWWLVIFAVSQAVAIILGCLPKGVWRSFASKATSPTPAGQGAAA